MTKRIGKALEFPRCKGREGVAAFDGGAVTSDAGVLWLRQADRRLGLMKRIGRVIPDPRRQASCTHDLSSLLRQRVYGVALGDEDLNDPDTLRNDLALQTAVDRAEPMPAAFLWNLRFHRVSAAALRRRAADAPLPGAARALTPADRHRLWKPMSLETGLALAALLAALLLAFLRWKRLR